MPSINVVVESDITLTPRVKQLSGMFDCPVNVKQSLSWDCKLPYEDKDWQVGLIVGASGSGKTIIARELFGKKIDKPMKWSAQSVIDDFDKDYSIEDISKACSAVGFNTIPAWMRPYKVLSNGEQFRVQLARRLLQNDTPIVIDEFTSVVDRQIAQIAANSVQKHVRKEGKQFVAISCHYDIIDWLQPDWIFDVGQNKFTWRLLRQRPKIKGEIAPVEYATWHIFAPYHYLTQKLHIGARCYCMFIDGRLASFTSVLHFPHAHVRNLKRFSRTVTLPDWQGFGLAFVLKQYVASCYRSFGYRIRSYPAHPSFVRSHGRHPDWVCKKLPGMLAHNHGGSSVGSLKHTEGRRPCAIFEYVGVSCNYSDAKLLLAKEKPFR